MKTTFNALGGFILATIIAIILVGGVDYASVVHAWSGDTRFAVLIMVILAAHGLRGISRA